MVSNDKQFGDGRPMNVAARTVSNRVIKSFLALFVFVHALSGLSWVFEAATELVLLLLVVLTAINYSNEPLNVSRFGLGALTVVAIFISSMFLISLAAPEPPTSLRYITPLFGGVLVFFVFHMNISSVTDFRVMKQVIAVSAAFISFLSLLHALGLPIPAQGTPYVSVLGIEDPSGPFDLIQQHGTVGIHNPTGFGIYVTFATVVWMMRAVSDPNPLARVTSLGMSVVCLLGVLFTFSRDAYVIVLCALYLFLLGYTRYLKSYRRLTRGVLVAVGLIGAAVGSIVVYVAMHQYSRFTQDMYLSNGGIIPRELTSNLHVRFQFLARGFEVFLTHPFTGSGIGALPEVMGISNAHNTYLSILVNNGLIVLTAFMILLSLIALHAIVGYLSDDRIVSSESLIQLCGVTTVVIGLFFFVATFSATKAVWIVLSMSSLHLYRDGR